MQSYVTAKLEQKRQAPDAEKQPRGDTIATDDFIKVAHRIRSAMAKARADTRKGVDPNKAKGYVAGRIENVLQHIVEHDDIDLIPGDVRRDYYYGMSYIGFTDAPEPIPAARIQKLTLRDIEIHAHLPPGSAGHGSCRRCGRTLTNPDSVHRGIGPECIKKR